MSPHPDHVFCGSRFCVSRDLHYELLARLDDALEPSTGAWLRDCYRRHDEALEHADTFDLSPAAVAADLRGRVATWRRLRSPQTRAAAPARRAVRRRRVVSLEAA